MVHLRVCLPGGPTAFVRVPYKYIHVQYMYMSRAAGSRASELTRQDIIDAAAGLAAERGYAGLTMRALAQRCGVPTMTLYRHVRTKEDILGALADRVLAELVLPEPGTLTWQEELAAVFRSVHDLLLKHPDVAVIAARQPVAGEAAYRGAEVVLDALRRGGIEGEPAASAFATLFAYTIGFVQQQLLSSTPGSLGRRQEVLERLPRDDFDNLGRLGAVFLLRSSDRHFQDGLDLIISGLESKARTRAEGPLSGRAAAGGARPVQQSRLSPGGTGQEDSRRNHRASRTQGPP